MWKEVFMVILVLGILASVVTFFYKQLPGEPINLREVYTNKASEELNVDYGNTPVFAENLRFNHNLISYSIDPSCPEGRKNYMKEAFSILHQEVNVISFYEVIKSEADILVGCSEEYIESGGDMFIAGEGGPSKYINNGLFNIILEGKIILYKDSECDYPVVELHELLHVFGFNHINNPSSIMYNVSDCDQRMTKDMADTLESLYSIEALPDIYIDEVNATKKGKYLDFYIVIKNRGLVDENNVSLVVSSERGNIEEFSLGVLEISSGRSLTVQNLKMPSSGIQNVSFEVVSVEGAREIDLNNNKVEMIVGN